MYRTKTARISVATTATPPVKQRFTEKQIQDKLKATLARITPGSRGPGIGQVRSKIRRNKRDAGAAIREEAALEKELQSKVLKATEF
jgi:translation initiation factor IF-2